MSFARTESRNDFGANRPVGEAVAEVLAVLLREQGGRHQHRDLASCTRGDKGCAQCDFGLAEADVAADHAIHWLRHREVADDRLDRGELVGRFLERETRGERFVHRAIDRDRETLSRLPARLDLEQLGGDIANAFGGLALGFLPLLAAERMQGCGFWRCAGIAVDQMQLCDRHVELVALRVFDLEVFGAFAARVERDQSAIATDAVILVHDRRADCEFAQIADDGFRIASGSFAATHARRAIGIELALGQHAQRRFGQREAVVERRDGDREARQRTLTPTLSRLRERGCAKERLPSRNRLWNKLRSRELFEQCLTPSRGIRRNQHATRIACEKAAQRRGGRLVLLVQWQRRRRLIAERQGFCAFRMRLAADFHATMAIDLLAQDGWWQIQLVRRKDRSFEIVTALFPSLASLRPECFAGIQRVFAKHDQRVLGDVIEQG
jgi:hypothetical protein